MTEETAPEAATTATQKPYAEFAERGDGGLSQTTVKGKTVFRAKRYVGLVHGFDPEGNPTRRPKYITGQGATKTAAKKNLQKNMEKHYALLAEERLLPRELRELTLANYWRENWRPAAEASGRYKTENSSDTSRRNMEMHVLPSLGSKALREITPSDIKELIGLTLPRKGLGPHTIANIRKALHTVLEDAVGDGKLLANPMARIKWRGAKPGKRKIEAPRGLVDAFRAEVAGTEEEARWMLGFILGLRPGETLGLCWDAVQGVLDDDRPYLTVKRQLKSTPPRHAPACHRRADGKTWTCGKSSAKCTLWADGEDPSSGRSRTYLEQSTKSSKVRIIALVEPLITLLKEQHARQERWRAENPEAWSRQEQRRPDLVGLVFTLPNGAPRRQQTDSAKLREILAKLRAKGIDAHFPPHGARHIAITRMALAGLTPASVRAIVGHADQETTELYTHVQAEDTRDQLATLGEADIKSYRGLEVSRAELAQEAKRQAAAAAKKKAEDAYLAWKADRTGQDGVVRFDPRTDPHPPLPLWEAKWMPDEVASALGQPGVKPEALRLFTGDLTLDEIARFAPLGATNPAQVREVDDVPDEFLCGVFD